MVKRFASLLVSLRFHTLLLLHQKLTKLRWYKRWHDFRFAHHVHVAALLGYTAAIFVISLTTVLFQPSTTALAASSSATQTTFAGTGDGTYTNAVAANSGTDVALNPVLSNAGGSGWLYKRPITVTNGSGGALTDYQVQVSPFTDAAFLNNANLVGSWHLNEGTGTTTTDISGNSNNGTMNGASYWNASGKFGSSYQGNGSSNKITVADNSSLTLGGSFTLETWVNPIALPTSGVIVTLMSKYDGTTNAGGYDLALYNNAGTQQIGLGTQSAGASGGGYVNYTLPVGSWSHVVAVFDGSYSKIYVNGTYVNQVANTVIPADNTKLLNIGAFGYYTPSAADLGRYFNGQIDEVKIYNRALAAGEIGLRYGTSGVPKVRSDYADLRFTNAVTGVEYPYWQESDGRYWVKVTGSLPAGTNTNFLNMYYGNTSASLTSSSNGVNTFDFFDDFSGDLSKWNLTGTTAIANGIASSTGLAGNGYSKIDSKTTFGANYSVRYKANMGNTGTGGGELLGWNGTGVATFSYGYPTSSVYNSYNYAGGTTSGNLGASYTGWHTFEVSRNSTTSNIYRIDDSTLSTLSTQVTSASIYPTITAYTATNVVKADWSLVRKFTATDPTHGAPGTEVSAYNTSGSFTSTAQAPTGVYNWGILTYTKTTPGTSTATVDVLNGATDAVISSNVATSTNLNLSGVTYPSLKIKVNYATSAIGEIPTLSDWSLAYSYDTTAPTVPTGLTIGTVTSNTVPLSWTASTDTESSVSGYEVQRAPDSAGAPGVWANVASGTCSGIIAATSCTDNSASANNKYYFRTRAKDVAGNYSGYSGEQNIDANTVGLWHLNGGTSGNLANGTTAGLENAVGSQYGGTASNANGTGMAWNQGKMYGGVTFDGTDDYVSVAGPVNLSSFTADFWVKFSDPALSQGILDFSTFVISLSTNKVLFTVPGSSNNFSTNTISDTNWHNIVVTGTSGDVKIYIDGVLDPNVLTPTFSAGSMISIGRRQTTATIYFKGQLDEIGVSNVVRSGADVLAYYNESNVQPKSALTLANAPVLNSVTSPTNNNKPTISNSSSPDTSFASRQVKLYDNGSLVASTTANGSGSFTFGTGDYSQTLADGAHTNITAKSTNADGVESAASGAVSITVDTVVATTALTTAPTPNDGSSGWFKTNPTITLTPTDPAPSGGSGTTYYKWDDAAFTSPLTYTTSINMNTSIGQGTHTLYWRNVDSASNTEVLNSGEFKLDSAAPAADTNSLVLGGGGSYINGSSGGLIDLHLTSSDTASGMNKTIISMDGVLYDEGSILCSFSYTTLIANWNLETQNCGTNLTGDGTKTVYVKFSDTAGNVSSAVSKSVTYDATNPGNTTSTVGKSNPSAPAPDLTSSTWYNYLNPTFEWDGATDATAGVKDYFVYFGTDNNADPVTVTDGSNLFYTDNSLSNVTTSKSYTVFSDMSSGLTYYLKIRSRDNALNVSTGSYVEGNNLFIYKIDLDPPSSITYIRTIPAGYTTTDSFTFEWDQVTDASSGIGMYRYQLDDGNYIWHDIGTIPDPITGKITLTGITKYKDDANIIIVQAVDVAGNLSDFQTKGYYYFAGNIPAPTNVTVDLSHSAGQSVNSFAFSWDKPATITPQGYYYSINTLPSAQNSTYVPYTGPSTTIGFAAFATRQGPNTFYVVTKANDTVGWTNYATPVTFSCNTTAPGIPRNVMITDSSNRDSGRWQLTVNWDEPAEVTADFNGYIIERSTDGSNYSEVATTVKTATGYLDTGLLNVSTYYYRIYAKDNTGNQSAASSVVFKQPTGKYTTAPNIVAEPRITIYATKATVTWSTDRNADSFVQVGATTSYGMTQGQLDTTTDHSVSLSGLTPGATYHYRTMWRDIDGNIGYSTDHVFKTQDAPGISEVTISDIRLTSAIISWKSTTISTSELHYGKTNAYGATAKDESSSSVTVHVIKLDTLDHSSTYHFKISSVDADGNVVSSDDYSFETLKFPIVSNFKVEQLKNMPTSTIKVTWDSNVPTTSVLTYSGHESAKSLLELKHSITVSGLKDNTTYTIAATGRDQYGTEAASIGQTLKTEFDTRPPEILNITSEVSTVGFGADTKGQAIISWETDEPSTSQVEYSSGVTGDYYDLRTQEDTGLSTSHVVIITGLKSSSSYHFRVVSRDAAANTGLSDDNSILTEQATSSVFDLIVNSLQNTIGWLFGAFR